MPRSNEFRPGDVTSFYDAAADAYAGTLGSSPSPHMEAFAALVAPGGKVLDVGFGSGADAAFLDSLGYDASGIDISPAMVEAATTRYPGIDFSVGDMRRLPVEPGSLAGIVAGFSLIHVPKSQVPDTLQGFHDALQPGGVLRLGLQEGDSHQGKHDAPFLPGRRRVFLNVMSRTEAGSLLEQAGFKLVQEFSLPPRPGQHPFNKRYLHARKV